MWTDKRTEFESKGVYYLSQIVNDGWTVTATTDPYEVYDAIITKGDTTYKAENKIRRYDLDRLETIYLAKKKLTPTVKYYLEYFPTNQVALVITYEEIAKGLENGDITTKKITVPQGQLKYEEGVDCTLEDLENLVIPKTLFRRRSIVC